MFLHRCPRINRIESIRTPFRFRAEGGKRFTSVQNARGDDFERIFASIKATLSRYGVGSVNEALQPSLSTTFHAASFDKLYALLLGMKTIVDMISQDAAKTMISTHVDVGPMVLGADPNASTKDVFSALLTRSETDFVMSLQADGVLTLAEYALRGLVDESYIFAHLPLRLKMPMGEKMKVSLAKVFSLQKAQDFLDNLEKSLVHSEQDLAAACDIDLPLRQYLVEICGYEKDSIHICEFPADLRVQHLVSLRMEMKRFFRSADNFRSESDEDVAIWDWAARNVAFLQGKCRIEDTNLPEETNAKMPPNTWGRLWFEHCEIKSSRFSSASILTIQAAWRMSIQRRSLRKAYLAVKSVQCWARKVCVRQVCNDEPSDFAVSCGVASYGSMDTMPMEASGQMEAIVRENVPRDAQQVNRNLSTAAMFLGSCSCVALTMWLWPPFAGLLLVGIVLKACANVSVEWKRNLQGRVFEVRSWLERAGNRSLRVLQFPEKVTLPINTSGEDGGVSPSPGTSTDARASAGAISWSPLPNGMRSAQSSEGGDLGSLDDWIQLHRLHDLRAPLSRYVKDLQDVVEMEPADIEELIAEHNVARVPARRLRTGIASLRQQLLLTP
jgi:hypothetical protein